jgi:cell division transport system permease protein
VTRFATLLARMGAAALRGFRASPVTTGVAIATIGVTLLLVGAFALVVGNMQGLLHRFGNELTVTAWIVPGLGADAQRELAGRVATIEGVARVELVTQDEALERFRRRAGGAALLEGLEENPLPASLEISLLPEDRTPEGLARVTGALDGLPGVDELAHGQDWVEGYARALALVRGGAVALGAVLAVAALLIVANTIRLAVYARRDELDILWLVGASRGYVRIPFLLEGVLQGVAGGALALGLLAGAWWLLAPTLEYGLTFFLGGARPEFFSAAAAGGLVAAGGGLGAIGSAAAVFMWRG